MTKIYALSKEELELTEDGHSSIKQTLIQSITLFETRNWLQARLTLYPLQSADQNPANLSKIIFSALNFFMHIFNMSVTYLSCIKRIH